jgi:hypothetical protein
MMTKAEKLTLTTMTANAWRALHEAELDTASHATSWASYQELNSSKYAHGLRCEWASLNELCNALNINMNDDSQLDPSVATIMQECVELSSATWEIYREFPDYPYRHHCLTSTETDADATNHDEEEEA